MPDEDLIRDVVNRIDEHTDDGGQGEPANQPAYGCDSKRILLLLYDRLGHTSSQSNAIETIHLFRKTLHHRSLSAEIFSSDHPKYKKIITQYITHFLLRNH